MPNLKLFVEDGVLRQNGQAVDRLLAEMKVLLVASLGVAEETCHLVAIGVRSLPGQVPASIEFAILRKPDRTREKLAGLCAELRDLARNTLGGAASVRCSELHAEDYMVIR